MNQKTAKKLRKLLKNAVYQRDEQASVTAPGVTEKPAVKTKQVGYIENEKNRKFVVVDLTEEEQAQANELAKMKDIERLIAMPEDQRTRVEFVDTTNAELVNAVEPGKIVMSVTRPNTSKKVAIAAGTIMVASGTIRGTYLALKKGMKNRALEQAAHA